MSCTQCIYSFLTLGAHFGKKCILAFSHTPPIGEHPGAVVVRDVHRAN